MLTAYKISNNYLVAITSSTDSNWLEDAVWIDLVNPTTEEIKIVETSTGISLPNIQETEELEASSHYEVYPTGFQINCLFLHKVEGTFSNTNVALLSNAKCIISLCAREIPAIGLLQKQWQRTARSKSDPLSTMIALLEAKIDKLADLSEDAYLSIEKITRQIFERVNTNLEKTIDNLSRQDDLNGKIRLCLMDGQRDLNFLLRRAELAGDNLDSAHDMLEDIKTLL